ncbi:hypothetical protein N0V93_002014 [Gnomoniopsis smithogilvyi]|uniref:Uncharacterized protein n=1 Tax=Gnomoniopsis smithogilvyi TaxID=1191159 RepID=A0A9W8Z2R6_9PEZI|nr:hypothetical protein N0V93_002014 [Gnomoniopsis smithogilvyi]
MKFNRALEATLTALTVPTLCASQANIFYDTTWAGPVQLANSSLSPNASGPSGFNLAEATLIIPTLSLPSNPHEQVDLYTASFWVGLDGFLLSDSIPGVRGLWQAGIFGSLSVNGTVSYTGFYEWVPEDPVSIPTSQLALAAGDHLYVRLNTSNGGLQGSVTLTNLNTSQTFAYSQDAPVSWRGPTWPAPGTSAEWIVEAGTYLNTTRYVWPDWGNATFVDARACWNTTGDCVVPGQPGGEERMTAVWWNDTGILYSRSGANDGTVWLAYVEEEFNGL